MEEPKHSIDMKKAALSVLFLLGVIILAAQQKDTLPYLRVEDPTQIFSSVGSSAGVTMEFMKADRNGYGGGEIYDAFWEFGLGGTVALGNNRFSMYLPITNNGNPTTALGDLQLECGYSFSSKNKTYRSTQIYGGVRFPTGLMDENADYYSLTYHGYFAFHLGYVGAVALNEKWFVYPRAAYYLKMGTPQTTYYIGGPCQNPPTLREPGFRLGAASSYRFGPRSFIALDATFENGKRSQTDNCGRDEWNFEEISQNLFLQFRFQYAITRNDFVFVQTGANFLNLRGEPVLEYIAPVNQLAVVFGYQYALGGK
jgi:hypothetical protein